MDRGVGEFEVVQGAIPESLAVVVALLTQLGDNWFLAVLLAVLYWSGRPNREDVAAVGGVWLAAIGLYEGLKRLFAFPRPDRPLAATESLPAFVQPVYEATAFATGYGFPSGHAVNATVVYLALATALSIGTRRNRFVAAGALVATISATRVALGVHYLVDVVAGVLVGVGVLAVAGALVAVSPADRATTGFAFAAVVASVASLSGAGSWASILVGGAALGGFAGWQVVVLRRDRRPARAMADRSRRRRGTAALVAVSLLVVGIVAALLVGSHGSILGLAGLAGLGTAVAISAPAVGRRSVGMTRSSSR